MAMAERDAYRAEVERLKTELEAEYELSPKWRQMRLERDEARAALARAQEERELAYASRDHAVEGWRKAENALATARRDALEEAAKVADKAQKDAEEEIWPDGDWLAGDIATAIRALASSDERKTEE